LRDLGRHPIWGTRADFAVANATIMSALRSRIAITSRSGLALEGGARSRRMPRTTILRPSDGSTVLACCMP
jgi:hypothetical protein